MYEIVLIGTSWGGLSAVSTVVADLPSTFALPLVTLVDGRGEYGLLIPEDATLTGVGLHMQALLSSNALTNRVVEPIR